MGDGGVVRSIHVTADAGAPLRAVDTVRALAGRGLEGDRYAVRDGTYSENDGPGRQVTLIEVEAIRALERDEGTVLEPGATRRNIVTEGVALNDLVGREFSVGPVLLRGEKLCEPCGYLQRRLGIDGLVRKLAHRAGLNAEILTDGEISVGDAVSTRSVV
jgi:MOSC domain-containing protein YiiM